MSDFQYPAFVEETTTTTGTGAYTTSGVAVAPYRTFEAALGHGSWFTGAVFDGTDFEIGVYNYSALNTVVRYLIIESSNAGAAVDWGPGPKKIYPTYVPKLSNWGLDNYGMADTPTNTDDDLTGNDVGQLWQGSTDDWGALFMCTAAGHTFAEWLQITTATGLYLYEGASDSRSGKAVLVAGSKVVNNTVVTADSNIQLTSNIDGGTPGWLRVSARTPGVSFTITSSNGADTSTVSWLIVEPALT